MVPRPGQGYLVGRTNEWVTNPLGLRQTSAVQIKTRDNLPGRLPGHTNLPGTHHDCPHTCTPHIHSTQTYTHSNQIHNAFLCPKIMYIPLVLCNHAKSETCYEKYHEKKIIMYIMET